jgi:hypothetical protein
MIKRTRLWALLGSSALIIGMMVATAGVVSADGQISWTGQGVTDGVLNSEVCDESNTPYLLFVFTPGGNDSITGGTLHLGGTGSGDYAINQDNGQWKATTPFFTLDGLTATLDYTGDVGTGNVNLVISHGCPGTTETAPPPTEVVPSPTFNISQEPLTEAPTEPSTDALGANGTSAPADGAWLLVVALGVLLASIVVLTPARAKSRR